MRNNWPAWKPWNGSTACALPDRDFWYDNRTGAAGLWQGPTLGVLPAGLELGGTMPANCSGGRTGVFINGREIHPTDVMTLSSFMLVFPGRYWADANGNFGFEGGPALANLYLLAANRQPAQQRWRGNTGCMPRVSSRAWLVTQPAIAPPPAIAPIRAADAVTPPACAGCRSFRSPAPLHRRASVWDASPDGRR